MNSNNDFFSFIQQGFRVTVGATASLIETIQDPTKRETTLSQLKQDLQQRTNEWAEKGETTEQEARRVLDELLNKSTDTTSKNTTDNNSQSGSASTPKTSTEADLKALTEQVVALRTELEALRRSSAK